MQLLQCGRTPSKLLESINTGLYSGGRVGEIILISLTNRFFIWFFLPLDRILSGRLAINMPYFTNLLKITVCFEAVSASNQLIINWNQLGKPELCYSLFRGCFNPSLPPYLLTV